MILHVLFIFQVWRQSAAIQALLQSETTNGSTVFCSVVPATVSPFAKPPEFTKRLL